MGLNMFGKIGGVAEQISAQVESAKNGAIGRVAVGAEKKGDMVGGVTQTLTENAIKIAVDQLRKCIDVAAEEWSANPGAGDAAILTATASVPGVSLQIQVNLKPVASSE